MIKYHTKVFFMSMLVIIFTSNKGMSVKDLVNKKNVSPKISSFESPEVSFDIFSITSEGVVKDGPFLDCAFKQVVYPSATKKYWAKCFIKGCPKSFGSEAEDLSEAALMSHLCEHLNNNDTAVVLAEKKMNLTCSDEIFSIPIDNFPTVLLGKNFEGEFCYSYKCNNCNFIQSSTFKESKLQNEWKRHSSSCYKSIINNILIKNQDKLTKKCCIEAKSQVYHVLGVHALYVKRIDMDNNTILN